MKRIRWGILGTGGIARQFARGLHLLPDAELVAIGSRQQDTADQFGDMFRVPRRHSSYEALAQDPDVDAVYIATPHALHCDNTLLCLRSGKATLCEKPLSVTLAQAEEMVACAREQKVFLMEAMWTRFLPVMVELRRLVAEKAVGEPHFLTADFGFRVETVHPESRLFNPKLGGGALLDVGVYTVSLASMLFGTPNRTASLANLGETGVDEQAAFVLGYEGGPLAVLYTAIRTNTPQEAVLVGTKGTIRVHSPWWKPDTMTVHRNDDDPKRLYRPYEGNGYQFEAAEVGRCLRAGELESPVMPLSESLTITRTMAEMRHEWGLWYPGER